MQKPTLLLVDDEPNILHALERVFQEDGYDILIAKSGAEGLELLKEHTVQVIISDERMPNMTGSEFLTEVKKRFPNTIRIILSAHAEFESLKSAINNGLINKFYNKPWDEDILRQGVREAFQSSLQFTEKEQKLVKLVNFAKLSGLDFSKTGGEDSILDTELNEAIVKKQFIILYQPIIDINTANIQCVEALLYWEHPTRGRVSPDNFIPLAENTGLIIPIGNWVLKTACHQLKRWHSQGYADLSVAVNLSVFQFSEVNLLNSIIEILNTTKIPPNKLEFEITENILMHDSEPNLILLQKLKKLGVKISLDDFGTKYSSLSYLNNFPIDFLKIDKSFVSNLSNASHGKDIAITILNLAKALDIKVIAEGIETKYQLDFLKENECDLAQGYYFSRPIEFEAMDNLLRNNDFKSKLIE